jgi:uncharacterized protein (DUF2141 family)
MLDNRESFLMRKFLVSAALVFALALGALPAAYSQAAGKIIVTVTRLHSDKGVVRCGLFNSPNGFRKPGSQFMGVNATPSGGMATCTFEKVPPGTYAVALFHAEKNETQMTYGFFGAPDQGYGFSNNPDTTFGPASFKDASFTYSGGDLPLTVKVSY